MCTAGRTIQDQENVRRRTEKGYARLTVKAVFFYVDDRMVASTDPGWLQLAFDTLTGLFDRVGLQTNVRKTAGMVWRSCQAARMQADKTYTRRMTGKGRSFKERKR